MFDADYRESAPTREEIDAMPGALVLEFGTGWCGHCQAATPLIRAALAGVEGVTHLRVEDGRGRPLGRAFAVKLWPTLVLMQDGREVARVVRPTRADDLQPALGLLGVAAADRSGLG